MRSNVFRQGATPRLGLMLAALFALGLVPELSATDSTWEYAVQLSATVQESPPQIALTWKQDSAGPPLSYTVFRKFPNDSSWGSGVVLPGTTTTYTDTAVSVGLPYEYQVHKITSVDEGYGYLYSGITVPLVENRGKLLLIVDSTYAAALAAELARLQQDLVGDGWTVIRQDVARTESVVNVKSFILGQYWADPANVNTVFLFGHVPVPYSGNITPDEHAEHKGAWPADLYYGDVYYDWTDKTVYDTNATDRRNWNVPGDGKFDQSIVPSPVALMVGRVDLSKLPGQLASGQSSFPSEQELLRQYLNKDHAFRQGALNLPRRGLVADFFGDAGGSGFSASAWRNFAPFFGAQNITFLPNQGTWLNELRANAYLWAYGCGPGQYTSASGLGTSGAYYYATTTDLVQADPKAVFLMLYGSWFGDWDSVDNLQRAVLATPTYGLVCCWSGSPHWFCQHMALGETIGFSTRLTQNNGSGLYNNQVATYPGRIHVALMGDPALRMHPVGPVSNLQGTASPGASQLTWTPSSDSVLGYHVYRSSDPGGPFARLTGSLLTGTRFIDPTDSSATYTYMVRAVKLELTPSGTYYNASQGAFITLTGQPPLVRTGVPVNSIAAVPAGIVLTWTTSPGLTYRISHLEDLATTNWSDFADSLTAAASSLSWTDTTARAVSPRFYRVFQVH